MTNSLMKIDEIKLEIKNLLIENLELELDADDIEDDELLFNGNLGIDSVSSMIIIESIESKFNIEVNDDEISLKLFESISSIASFVANKLST